MARSKKSAQTLNIDSTVSSSKESRTPSPSRTRSPLSPESERPVGPLSVVVSSADRDTVKVNNANATELKNACDDAVKRVSISHQTSYFVVALGSLLFSSCSFSLQELTLSLQYLSRPELFKQIHLHTDVRLGLGWLSVFVAAGTALYGYKVDFEKSKPVVSIGLVV